MTSPPPVFGAPAAQRQADDTRKNPLAKTARGALWIVLIMLGALLGLAAVSAVVSTNIDPMEPASEEGLSNEIQASSPSPVRSPDESLVAALLPLPLSGGQSAHQANGVTIVPVETQCEIERVLEWSRPGGVYCAITLTLYGQGLGISRLIADEQAIYPLDTTLMGYRGSFFISGDNVPRKAIDVPSAGEMRVVLIVDTPRGFQPAQAYLRSAVAAP